MPQTDDGIDTDVQALTASTYLALAELLDQQTDTAWNTDSLCEGWRVREVVAHITMPSRYTPDEFVAELQAHGFDFGRLSDGLAARDADLPAATLVADLRSGILHRWVPPRGGSHGALNHAVIHTLDAAVPLGHPATVTDHALATVLDDLTAGGVHSHFGTTVDGRRLEATDLDWSWGSGDPLRGPAHQLALALCGRRTGDLAGTPISS
ncbi:MAG: maleylpyruvate isomerase family mycothiol-dependent enzyme [Pseudonocardia sp.]|uniref:maleylpyruvate isomerase family mycothiol-dependent enzyme n=1 Tax=unclassified Pseudonocardia TaxID=2619320 RepID=UPI00086AD716|nr:MULTISPECIES: maleylpyruvate isomerase family mycothiol-dependent enzyme [unclassified Pseudonocardia]MBN9107179.1 maleylpyruvate isomerase family mycothiol-dependent enzyme [Pseudonocardia sp.]ODU26934.1 MAG: hypothetical protein ABS80_04910 [Pseudonocardia sp. SCN 72-51]ODV05295.1 MAG: hypothetical protein ABT15_17495 [Pseudonocardia sp. SCN 73-27]